MASVCAVCGRDAPVVLSYTKLAYCLSHFRKLLVKRLRKDLRIQGFNPSHSYVLVGNDDPLAPIAIDLLRWAYGRNIDFSSDASAKVVICCLEHDVTDRFERFLAKESVLVDEIRLLRSITLEELSFFGDVSGVVVSVPPLLETLQRKHPATLFAFSRSFEEIGKKEKNKRNRY